MWHTMLMIINWMNPVEIGHNMVSGSETFWHSLPKHDRGTDIEKLSQCVLNATTYVNSLCHYCCLMLKLFVECGPIAKMIATMQLLNLTIVRLNGLKKSENVGNFLTV